MTVAQGINKILTYKKQTAQGAHASGTGGQRLRRRTANFNLTRDTYENDEIVSHQQSTGATAGMRRVSGTLAGLISPKTYADFIAAALRKDFVAGVSAATLTVSIAASGQNFTVTRTAGSWIADGFKVFDVIRLSGAGLNAANSGKNLLIVGLTATVATVRPVNGAALVPEAGVASVTATAPGKKTWAPTTSHTDDWFTFEEWQADLNKSQLAVDVKTGAINIGLPATGNTTIDIEFTALDRKRGDTQVLTTPALETTTGTAAMITGVVMIGQNPVVITGAQLNIGGGIGQGEAEAGTNTATDVQRGRITVSGQFSAKFRSSDLQDAYDDQTPVSLGIVLPVDGSPNSPFVSFVVPMIKLFGDAADDGEKEIIRTYPFTGQINGAGGPTAATELTILSHQDSEA